MSLVGVLEFWVSKLKGLSGRSEGLPHCDWLKLEKGLACWTKQAAKALKLVDSVQCESDRIRQRPQNRWGLPWVCLLLKYSNRMTKWSQRQSNIFTVISCSRFYVHLADISYVSHDISGLTSVLGCESIFIRSKGESLAFVFLLRIEMENIFGTMQDFMATQTNFFECENLRLSEEVDAKHCLFSSPFVSLVTSLLWLQTFSLVCLFIVRLQLHWCLIIELSIVLYVYCNCSRNSISVL